MPQVVAASHAGLLALTIDAYAVPDSALGHFRKQPMARRLNTVTVVDVNLATSQCRSTIDSTDSLIERSSGRRIAPTTGEPAKCASPIKHAGARRTKRSVTRSIDFSVQSKQASSRAPITA